MTIKEKVYPKGTMRLRSQKTITVGTETPKRTRRQTSETPKQPRMKLPVAESPLQLQVTKDSVTKMREDIDCLDSAHSCFLICSKYVYKDIYLSCDLILNPCGATTINNACRWCFACFLTNLPKQLNLQKLDFGCPLVCLVFFLVFIIIIIRFPSFQGQVNR